MKTDLNLDEEILYNKAVLNVNSGSSTEDEFVDAVFVYLHSIEESLSEYFEGIVDNFYEEKEE
jgi:4-hydroxy-3-methylbut-2-enyl diphosphate reductase IspH